MQIEKAGTGNGRTGLARLYNAKQRTLTSESQQGVVLAAKEKAGKREELTERKRNWHMTNLTKDKKREGHAIPIIRLYLVLWPRIYVLDNVILLRALDFVSARPFRQRRTGEAEFVRHVVEIVDTCPVSTRKRLVPASSSRQGNSEDLHRSLDFARHPSTATFSRATINSSSWKK